MNSKPNADTNSMTPLNKDSNIVALNSPVNVSANASAAPARSNRRDSYNTKLHRNMTAPMVALQELSQRVLMKCLQDMFDKIDDALFELAEKASSNAEQNIFFESMREVRLKRIDIEAQYADALGEGFLQLFTATPVAMDPNASIHKAKVSSQDHSESDLTLMADDTVEEMVAMEAMVARADKRLLQPLDALLARINALVMPQARQNSNEKVAARSNPIGPQRLCDIFSNACLLLNIDIKARLVVFKLYEKYLVERLDTLYAEANKQLITHNVLPDYRPGQQSSDAVPAGLQSNASTAWNQAIMNSQSQGKPADLTGFDYQHELHALLQQLHQSGFAQSSVISRPLVSAIQLLPVNKQPAIGQELLLQLLTAIQREPQRLPNCGEEWLNGSGVLMPAQLTQGLNRSLNEIANGGDHSIGHGERDVISLVALLFQLVLDDRNLAEPIKAAISRLQIPVIKIAMQDSHFFAEKNHPARRLLNEMTLAVTGWEAEDNYQNDSLYQAVCAAVERVSCEFVEDVNIFSQVLADFLSYIEHEKKRISLREKRVVDAEAGRDQSESARQYVTALIEARAMDSSVPVIVRSMIETNWNNILFLTYLKKGLDSQEWRDAITALDDLLWTVAAARSMADRTEIMRRIPGLLKTLRHGLSSINYDNYAAGEFFAHLEHLHMDVMQRAAPLISDAQSANTQHAIVQNTVEPQVTEPNMPVGANATTAEVSEADATSTLDASNPYMAKAKMLGVGQWVEFIESDKKMRCRLVAVLRNSGKRIFANRSGIKVGEYQVQEIGEKMADESLVLLEDAQLFDKALSSIIDNLRQTRAASTA